MVGGAAERQALLKEVLATMREGLSPLGFRLNGRRFERTRGEELIDYVCVQTDRYPAPTGLCYRVNVETLPLPLWQLDDWGASKPGPNHHLWETTLGEMMDPPEDRWQTVHTRAEARMAAKDDLRIVVEHALPFLERVGSAQDVVDGWKREEYVPFTPFYRDRMIARWEDRPEPRREDYPAPTAEELETALRKIEPMLREVARQKADFHARRQEAAERTRRGQSGS